MKRFALEFQINQMRQQKIVLALESLLVFVGALFSTALLPQILFKYLYANAQLTAEPVLLSRIPDVSFAVGALFFLYATVESIMLSVKIGKAQKELMLLPDDEICCIDCDDEACACDSHEGCLCGCDDEEEVDMEIEVAPVTKMAEKMKTASSKKKSTTKKSK